MILFIVSLKAEGEQKLPAHAIAALQCARLFSGCRCVGLTDMPLADGWESVTPYSNLAFRCERTHGLKRDDLWSRNSTYRWFAISEYIRAHDITEPIFSCDWDLMIFENLWEFFEKKGHETHDYGICIDKVQNHGAQSAPYMVRNLDAIRYFCDLMLMQFMYWPPLMNNHCWADQVWWAKIPPITSYTYFDMNFERDDKIFDMNIALKEDAYEHSVEGSKEIVWQDSRPHFIRTKDKSLVRCVGLHCFMAVKETMPAMLEMATT